MLLSREQVVALHQKYAELTQLRREREELERAGVLRLQGTAGQERRARMQGLAEQFPGTLREIEGFAAAHLDARRAHLQRWLEGGEAELAPWVAVVWHFHARLRQLMEVALFQRHHPRASLEDARDATDTPDADVERAWDALQRRAPGQRLSDVVWTALAAELAEEESSLRRHLYGDPP